MSVREGREVSSLSGGMHAWARGRPARRRPGRWRGRPRRLRPDDGARTTVRSDRGVLDPGRSVGRLTGNRMALPINGGYGLIGSWGLLPRIAAGHACRHER